MGVGGGIIFCATEDRKSHFSFSIWYGWFGHRLCPRFKIGNCVLLWIYSDMEWRVGHSFTLPWFISFVTTEKMHQVWLRHKGNTKMGTKTLRRCPVAWRAGSGGWCARGSRIESRGEPPIIAPPILRQIGLKQKSVRVNTQPLVCNAKGKLKSSTKG